MYVPLEEDISSNVSLKVFLTFRHLRKIYQYLNEMGTSLHSTLCKLGLNLSILIPQVALIL